MGQAASPSLYDFAGGDPVNFFDAYGRCPGGCGTNNPVPAPSPTPITNPSNPPDPTNGGENPADPNIPALQLAMVSSNVYGDGGQLPPNILKLTPDDIADLGLDPTAFHTASGMNAGLYYDLDTGQYILAYAGTVVGFSKLSALTITADVTQALGLSTPQYTDAINLAESVDAATGSNLVITGHSLGGGLAAAAALATGDNAVTFNAAGLSSATLNRYNLDASQANSLIQNYSVRGEILSTAQSTGGQFLTAILTGIATGIPYSLPSAVGTQISLTPASSASPLTLHKIGSVISALGGT
jgi:hypothetical protein